MVESLKGLVISLAVIAIVLLFYAAQLPQYGDGAIGTVWVFVASFAVYVVMLITALPLAVRAFRRGETIAQSAWLCSAIASPLAAWLLVIWWTSRA